MLSQCRLVGVCRRARSGAVDGPSRSSCRRAPNSIKTEALAPSRAANNRIVRAFFGSRPASSHREALSRCAATNAVHVMRRRRRAVRSKPFAGVAAPTPAETEEKTRAKPDCLSTSPSSRNIASTTRRQQYQLHSAMYSSNMLSSSMRPSPLPFPLP